MGSFFLRVNAKRPGPGLYGFNLLIYPYQASSEEGDVPDVDEGDGHPGVEAVDADGGDGGEGAAHEAQKVRQTGHCDGHCRVAVRPAR